MDVMESPIERPQESKRRILSGKQGEHTLKTQLVVYQKVVKSYALRGAW